MERKINILQLSDIEGKDLLQELETKFGKVKDKVKTIEKIGCKFLEALEYVVVNNPMLWAYVYLDWTVRDYQKPIIYEGRDSKTLVLRLGRRLGKTDCMCVLILWYAYTQMNKGDNGQYNVLIIAPYELQVDLIFTRLKQLINRSPLLQDVISRSIHHRYEFKNGSIIQGITAGASNSNSGGNSTRGQAADVIFIDEVDYVGSAQITNIINIRNEAPKRIKIIAASTPCGKHEEFYKWCTNASKKYAPPQEDIDNFEFNGYKVKDCKDTGEQGNGWTEIYAPSIVNKELLEINEDTGQTYLQDIKDELSELRYEQEVMARFGDQEMGVYQKRFINAAIQEGIRVDYRYIDTNNLDEIADFVRYRTGITVLGVDWDKYNSDTTLVGVYLDKTFINKDGVLEPKFKVIFREQIARSEFTYVNAMNRIIHLNELFDFDWISIDRGYGEIKLNIIYIFLIILCNNRNNINIPIITYKYIKDYIIYMIFLCKELILFKNIY